MSEKDIVSAYAKELKLASVRENAALFAEDAMREQWGISPSCEDCLKRK